MRAKEEEFRSTCFGSLVSALPEEGFAWKRTAWCAASAPPPPCLWACEGGDSDVHWPGSRHQPWSCPQLREPGDPGFTMDEDWKVSDGCPPGVQTEHPLVPWGTKLAHFSLASLPRPILFHLPPSSSTDRVYSASTADLNCGHSLNKYNCLEITLLFINFHSV